MNARKTELLRRYRMQLFTATWLSYAGFYFARKVYAVLKHPLKDQFGFDDVQIAWPWTIYLITYMLGQFVAVWLGRRLESRRVLAWGMCTAAGCNIVFGLAGRFASRKRIPVDLRDHGNPRPCTGDGLAAQRRAVCELDAPLRARNAVRHLGQLLPDRRDRGQGPRRIPARLAGHGMVVLRLEHRAARVHRVLRPVRERAATIRRPVAGRRGRTRRRSFRVARRAPRSANRRYRPDSSHRLLQWVLSISDCDFSDMRSTAGPR